jgi:hypothetical protein
MVVKLFRRLFSILQLELQLDLKVFTMVPSKRKFPSVPTAVVQRQTVKLEVRTGFKSNKSQ